MQHICIGSENTQKLLKPDFSNYFGTYDIIKWWLLEYMYILIFTYKSLYSL